MNWNDLSWLYGPLNYFQLSSKRIFYVFLISSLLIVIFRALFLSNRGQQLKSDFKKLFSWRIWLHPSSLVDIKCLFVNNWIYILLVAPFIWNAQYVLVWLAYWMNQVFESKGMWNHWPQWLVTSFYTLVLFTCSDLSRYLLHYAFHRYSWLWRFHKVHHSAEVLTPMTLYRAHPVEMLIYKLRAVLVVGVVSGLFYYFFEGKMKIWHILGVNGFGFLFNLFGSNLRHSQVWLGFGVFEHIFISPAQHQMHHSRDIQLARSNIGSCFAFWDKLFGTFRLSAEVPLQERGLYGIQSENLNHNSRSWVSSFSRPFLRS